MPPRAREEGIVIHEIEDELLIYDLDRHKAHCMNRVAALIWRRCDGSTTPLAIAERIGAESGVECTEEVVLFGLERLSKAHLLSEGVLDTGRGISRRDLIRRFGIGAALALPAITSLIAPEAASAATCGVEGDTCFRSSTCCGRCCKDVGGGKLECKPGGGNCLPQ